MRIAVTGGSGGIGLFTVREFQERGYEVRNLDVVRPAQENIPTTIVDLANFGDLVSCLNGFDAVVHLGAIPAPKRTSNNAIFRINTQSTFNVLEASSMLGIRKVCLASSINALGMGYNLEQRFRYFPVDELHPCQPDEAYGLSKQVGEVVADAFSLRFPRMTISSMRYPAVLTPERYETLDRAAPHRRKILWAYADVREVARANRLAIEADWTGHEVFFITADHTLSETQTEELLAKHHPDVEIRSELAGHASIISSTKAEKLLGWKHQRHLETELKRVGS